MSTAVMIGRIAELSPRPSARITGVIYLLYFLTAVLGEFFLKGMVVDGDATATANNLLAHQPLFRLGMATGLIATACYIAVTALFYGLFKPVDRSLSLLAAFFGRWDVLLRLSAASLTCALGSLGRYSVLARIQSGTIAGPGVNVFGTRCSDRQHLPGTFWIL